MCETFKTESNWNTCSVNFGCFIAVQLAHLAYIMKSKCFIGKGELAQLITCMKT